MKINHLDHGRIDCAPRGGCPVLPEAKALELLSVMEKADRGELFTDGHRGSLRSLQRFGSS